jgi:hypothetical protein
MSLAGILDQNQAMRTRQGNQARQIAGMTIEMNWQNRPGPRRKSGLDKRGIKRERLWLDIHKDRHSPHVQNRVRRSYKAQSGRDNFVACANTMRQKSQVKRGCSRRDGYCFSNATRGCKAPFKGCDLFSLGKLARSKHSAYSFCLLDTYQGTRRRYHLHLL